MTHSEHPFPRGSEWRVWDLHIHSPASYEWAGEKYGDDEKKNIALVDCMISAINEADPAVFAIMDYWTFDGWFRLKHRAKSSVAPQLHKTVFPGIELRLSAPMKPRLNAHAIFSNEISDQSLKDFISQLRLEITGRPLSEAALVEYARQVSEDKLRLHGLDYSRVQTEEKYALLAGHNVAELTVASYKDALKAVPDGQALGFLPFNTYGGLKEIDRNQHYAYAVSLFQESPIFETRDVDQWAAFAGIETDLNKEYLPAFQKALGNRPRLAVAGSDAHRFTSVAKSPDNRGYGKFPSDIKTWIKADPTWNGLQLALKEPGKRSFLGVVPPKLSHVQQNRTFYIDSIRVEKNAGSSLPDHWFDGCNIPLNSDLVAVIGNKGSGKSALADIIALLGQTKDKQHFSFLKPGRFLGKAGEPARHFNATLFWLAGKTGSLSLSEAAPPESVELVRYIPQGRFEALCNDHVSGRPSAFEGELRTVVFSHVPTSEREGALNFDQLTEIRERVFRTSLDEQRKNLRALNAIIVALEDGLHPTVRQNLMEQQKLKEQQLQEVLAQEPPAVTQPSGELSAEQQQAALRIAEIAESVAAHNLERVQLQGQILIATKRLRSVSNIEGGLQAFQGRLGALKEELVSDLTIAGVSFEEIVELSLKYEKLKAISKACSLEISRMNERLSDLLKEDTNLTVEASSLKAQLNAPQLAYQDWLNRNDTWRRSVLVIRGSEVDPESLEGIKARIAQIDAMPSELIKQKARRNKLTEGIFTSLDSQRKSRAELFSPVQDMIGSESVIGHGYNLQFKAKLHGSAETVASNLFDLVKQVAGELRGDEESAHAIRTRFEKFEFVEGHDATQFAASIEDLLNASKPHTSATIPGLRPLMRKDRDPKQVYDYLYGLEYLEPQYSLLFQSTPIEQLSPGQRGALLLIFYLLVDKGRNPIILDQPEENLDNETVVSLLVPVLSIAKQRRQIIMVTHNPNLAVVCDAEQIIHAKFERNPEIAVTYSAGSIENPRINKVIVDILEGTKFAFDNRSGKYQ